MAGQPRPGFGRAGRAGADNQRSANPVLQRADALRDGGRGHVKCSGGVIKAAMAQNSGQRGQVSGIELH